MSALAGRHVIFGGLAAEREELVIDDGQHRFCSHVLLNLVQVFCGVYKAEVGTHFDYSQRSVTLSAGKRTTSLSCHPMRKILATDRDNLCREIYYKHRSWQPTSIGGFVS